jgi:hypothetical protein
MITFANKHVKFLFKLIPIIPIVIRQPVGNGPTDSACRTGDQDHLSFSLNR